MIKTVLTIRTLILLLALGFPARMLATSLTCSVSGANPYCSGNTVTINYNSSSITFQGGNVFTVELSDAMGSFASPTTIGTSASTSQSGSILATLPTNSSGTAYRIRVVASHPGVVGTDNGSDVIIYTYVTPSVSIAGPPFVCSGSNTTFTATPTDGGATPSYQWKRNGNSVGSNSATFTTNNLVTGDVLVVEMTSDRPCISQPTVTSNSLNITLTSIVNPTIAITADPSTAVGAGSAIYFSSTATGGGSAPAYQWKRNGTVVGTSNALLITDPKDDDQVMATLTSSANCAQSPTVDSNTIILSVNDSATQSNHAWSQRTGQSDIGGAIVRMNGSGFSIGTKGYIGLGYVGSTSNLRKDFWEYDPATDAWTQKANFAGAARYNAVGFSVAGKGYIGTGATATGVVKDFYQYDPITNTWKVRTSLPGAAPGREQAFGFGAGVKGYIGGGYTGSGDLNDFYEFDPLGNSWSVKASFGGGKRLGAASFAIDNKAYVAGGYSTTSTVWFKDLWDYDPGSNTWTQHADMPGDGRSRAIGFALAGNGYVGLGNTSAGYAGQTFQYNVSTDSWKLVPYYPGPQTTNAAVGMTIGNRAFVYKDGVWTEFNFFTTSSFSSKICTNETIPISFDASGYVFPPNTTFVAQISTQSNFSVGTNLGTLTSDESSGVIPATFMPTIASGDYYFRIITNNAPPLSTMLESITVTNLPATQSITTTAGPLVCNGVPVVFTTNLGGTNFQWFKNNSPVGTDSPTYTDATLANSDVISVIKIFTAGCSQPTAVGSNFLTMKVRTPPKPVITVSQPNTLVSTAAIGYQWFQNGNAISQATDQSYVMTESGIYKVKTTDTNGCEAYSDEVKDVFTGLYDEELQQQINTYPNPVTGEMVLEVADDLVMKGVDYSVINELGQPVIAPQKASRSNKINLTGRSSGLYLLRLSINGSTLVRRVVKVD